MYGAYHSVNVSKAISLQQPSQPLYSTSGTRVRGTGILSVEIFLPDYEKSLLQQPSQTFPDLRQKLHETFVDHELLSRLRNANSFTSRLILSKQIFFLMLGTKGDTTIDHTHINPTQSLREWVHSALLLFSHCMKRLMRATLPKTIPNTAMIRRHLCASYA